MATFDNPVKFNSTVKHQGAVTFAGGVTGLNRSHLGQQANQILPVPLTKLRKADYSAVLPAVGDSTNLGLVGAVHGTGVPSVQGSDTDTASKTEKARFELELPYWYDPGASLSLLFNVGYKTNLPDTTGTLDLSVFKSDGGGLKSGIDLYTGAALDITDLAVNVFGIKTFAIVAGGLVVGDILDCLITVASVDGGTGAPVLPLIGFIRQHIDVIG